MFFKKKSIKEKEIVKKNTKSCSFNSNLKADWSDSSYFSLSKNGYISNSVANRCINLISQCVCSVSVDIFENEIELKNERLTNILKNPSRGMTKSDFLQHIVKSLMISGNSYIKYQKNNLGEIIALIPLRSDRISIVSDNVGNPVQYIYTNGANTEYFDIDQFNGADDILHIKLFNPIDDIYGISPLFTARFAIDQYNEAISWNKALLQNGARPSGALVVESNDLTDDQFDRLKNQITSEFTGGRAAGKVMILEGGLRWQEMGVSPKDMDFIETKHSAARDIALSFGVPVNLIGIQGDNTYSNMVEARVAFWEETILPICGMIYEKIQTFINLNENRNILIKIDTDSVSVLTEKRYQIWNYLNNSGFLSDDEKRFMLGFGKKD